MEEVISFGDWLKQRRKALDLTRAELAQQVGCAVVTIQKLELDARRPSKEIAARLAEALAIPPEARDIFLRVARAALAPDHLPAPRPRAVDQDLPVETGPAEAAGQALPSGTVTLLFTDIEGS